MTMRHIILYAVGFFIICISPACLDLKQPSLDMQYYTLEYEAPALSGHEALPFIIRVENFNAAPLYSTTGIIFKEREYKRDIYPYHKWMTSPANIVTYLIGRDLKKAGMFKGVIMPGERNKDVSLRLAGIIDEFYELDKGGEQWGVLTIGITLTPEESTRTKGMVIFQKSYSIAEKMERKTPTALSEALSRAMEKVSQEIEMDIYEYIEKGVKK
jgi:ABC-type uncharacterized transport system auxiliary subunit